LYFILNDLLKDDTVRTILVYGGKSSSKTVSIAQILIKELVVKNASSIAFRKESSTIPTTLKKTFNLAIDSMYLSPAIERQDRRYITKTGAEWKSYFVTNPPDCATDDNSLYGTTITGVAGSTITMPPNTGTAFTIAWDNTIMTSGWVQVGTSIDITPSVLAGGEEVKVTYTKP